MKLTKALSPNELLPILHLIAATPNPPATHITGPASTGKTETLRTLAHLTNRPVEIVDLATRTDAAEVFGFQIPRFAERDVVFMPNSTLKKVCGSNSILFFDDFTYAGGDIKNACMRLALDRKIEDYDLGPGVFVCFATNPVNFVANGSDLPPALATRMLHILTTFPSVEESNNYDMANGRPTPPSLPKIDPEVWRTEHAVARAHISAFRLKRPNLATEEPDAASGSVLPSYATPRGYTMFAKLLATSRTANNAESRAIFAAGAIGLRAGGEFETWLVEADLPSPMEVLEAPTKWAVNKQRPDRVLAIVLGCAAYAAAHPEWIKASWKVLDHCAKGGMKAIASTAAHHVLRQLDPTTLGPDQKLSPEVVKVLEGIREITV